MSYNHRSLIKKSGSKIIVKEDNLDIFYNNPKPLPSWLPHSQIKPYKNLSTLTIDIETAGLNPQKDRIFGIGSIDESKNVFISMEEDEVKLLEQFITHFNQTSPDIIYTYHGTIFDLPFIISRCNRYGIKHPFRTSTKPRVIKTAQVFGKPLEINEIYIQNIQHIDIYICVLRWDFIFKTLSNASLKTSVLEMGLRSTPRLVLDHKHITEYFAQGAGSHGWQKIKEYLSFDLEDTLLLADKLVPPYYYESLIVPKMDLQQLAITGNATKWQRILENQYPDYRPQADSKKQFEGGLVISVSGLHYNVAKIDVSSLYPSIMLKYGICSLKDKNQIALCILKYLTNERLRLKKLGKAGDASAKQAEGALKVLINSLYGFYGTSGVGFNDMVAAALVAAYGRRILRFMIDVIEKAGGIQVESDTDGIFFSHPEPVKVFEKLQASLPDGINVELETIAKAMFIPTKGSKNYVVWHEDNTITTKGSWRKRDRSVLEKEFPLNYLTHYLESKISAENYYQELLQAISSRNLSVKKLQITRKIRKGEKALLCLGNTGDVVTFYQGYMNLTNSEPYSISYYLELITRKREEILSVIEPQIKSTNLQLSLF